jgi:hypothetical protein
MINEPLYSTFSVKIIIKKITTISLGAKLNLIKGKLEKQIVDPYLPNKIIPPEYIRDVLIEANKAFPLIEFDYEIPHRWPIEEYKTRYELLERQMLEILKWRINWFGQLGVQKK